MRVNEILNEASRPRRAWNNKLSKIDKILAWMYDKDILTATDKKRKDKVFYQYYRYYNDGDMPAALKVKGFSKWSGDEYVEKELEKYLETFIKEMLSKYLPRVNRSAFRLDTLISELQTIRSVASRNDVYSLLTYWLKKVKIKDEEGILKGLVGDLQAAYDEFVEVANIIDPSSKNYGAAYRREEMMKAKTWTQEAEKKYQAMAAITGKIDAHIADIVKGATELRKVLTVKK